jgi:hypothetical protein
LGFDVFLASPDPVFASVYWRCPCAGRQWRIQSARAINESTTDNTNVDIKGNEYSFPKIRSVKSPGNLPMPIFLNQGIDPERIASAIKVVSIQRIMTKRS